VDRKQPNVENHLFELPMFTSTVCFTDLDQGSEILSRFSLPKSMKHTVFLALYLSYYSVFQGFRQAKSANGGLILSSNQFLILPQLLQKMKLASKVVKVNSKIIISLPKI
jgi:hypothetical protein